jgi:hypothetical protein
MLKVNGVLISIFLISVFVASAASLMAQTAATGALTGTVTDPTGAVVGNVAVTATNTDTGQARTATTGTDGTYKIGLLPPGSYRVQFEATGFNTVLVPSSNGHRDGDSCFGWPPSSGYAISGNYGAG